MKTTFLLLTLAALPFAMPQEKEPVPTPPPVPAVGKSAPAFRLNDHTGRAVAVGGKAARWTVLAFYPKAMTPG